MRCLLAAVVAVLLISGVPITAARPAHAQGSTPATLEVTKITPSVVTPTSPGEVTITGRITNNSGSTINDVQARLQRGQPTAGMPAVQDALRGNAGSATGSDFAPAIPRLAPGQQAPFQVRVPLAALQIDRAGTFPMMLDVNGSPGDGESERIGEARFLLPVASPPGRPPAKPPRPTPTTLLVPIVDYPRMEQQGAQPQRPVLSDDSLAASLTPGGRLFDIVEAVNDQAGNGSPLGNGLCFAIDPDLLATVNAMQNGYQVRQPDGGLINGTGAASAQLWLNKLRQATAGRCVISLPYADSDVVALGRADLPDLIDGALDGSLIVQHTLHMTPRNVLWPIEGALDERTAGELAGYGVQSMLLEPSAMAAPNGSLEPVRLRAKGDPTGIPIDPLLSEALDPLHGTPQETTALSPPANGALTAHNALGALAFRANAGTQPGATSVLAPPRRWNITGEDMSTLLDGMRRLTDAGYITPEGLPEPGGSAEQSAPPLPPARLSYPQAHAAEEIPQPVLDEIARQNYKVGDLFRSSSRDPAADLDPRALTTPLRDGLLRGASSAWRGNPETAWHWTHVASDTLGEVLSRVRLDEFSGKITLTASNAPIPLTVTNDLPVTISVVLRMPATAGIETKDLGVIRVPAQGRRHFRLETEVHRAGQFTVDVDVTTKEGTKLGAPKRLQLQSYTYDPFTVGLTSIASALLIVLSARRILRRLRARRARIAATNTDPESTAPNPVVRDHPGAAREVSAPTGSTTESDRGQS